jgi:hypothetical protein
MLIIDYTACAFSNIEQTNTIFLFIIQLAIVVFMVRTVLRSAVSNVKTGMHTVTMLTETAHMDALMGGRHHCVTKVIFRFSIYEIELPVHIDYVHMGLVYLYVLVYYSTPVEAKFTDVLINTRKEISQNPIH